MTLVDIIRRIVPRSLGIVVGVWAINQASRHWLLLKLYLTILHGTPPANMGLDNGYCYYDYGERRVIAPYNAAGVFLEVFQDEVYEQMWRPQYGDTVLDVGAYVGMFTVKAADLVGTAGKVIAIEPSPQNFDLLGRNCEGLGNVGLFKGAIMATSGVGRLYYSKSPAANSLVTRGHGYVEVETITLDELAALFQLDKIDFIKLDAEGAELEVLKGGLGVLEKGVRLSIAAYHTTAEGRQQIGELRAFLRLADYTIRESKGLRSYIYAEKTH